ncbi:MAG: GxxExxY protein [Flavobacteriales bacterium]|nr:GxxExxY protein [Flavobacteriales bacterium]
MDQWTHNELTEAIIGAAIEVHRELGPGLLESIYEECLARELSDRGVPFQRQQQIPVMYKGSPLDMGFRCDLFVNDMVIVEVKAVEALNDVHIAQLLTYLKLADRRLGLLINFNVKFLKQGLKRVANGMPE